jgi:guanylate kinase
MIDRPVVVFGPSGVGKSTIIKRVLELCPDVRFSVSHTTRDRRPGEIDGREYHFISKSRFRYMIEDSRFAEWAEFPPGTGTFYGTTLKEMNGGGRTLLEIELQGVLQIRECCPEALLVFIAPPDVEFFHDTLRERIRTRGEMDANTLNRRLAQAEQELCEGPKIAHRIIVNDDLAQAIVQLIEILKG